MAYVRQHPTHTKFRKKIGAMPDFTEANNVSQETPVGVMNGINKEFTLHRRPLKNSETIFKDGMKMKRASTVAFIDGDYIVDYLARPKAVITFSDKQVPQVKSVILADYRSVEVSV